MLMYYFVLHGICLLTFSHDAVRIFASPESIAGDAPNYKMGELQTWLEFDISQQAAKMMLVCLKFAQT